MIIAFFIFLAIKLVMHLKNSAERLEKRVKKKRKKGQLDTVVVDEATKAETKPTTEELLTEIRDILKVENDTDSKK